MKESADIKQFKNELRNYKYYLKQIEKWDERIDDLYNSLPGSVHSINPAVPLQTGGVPNKDFEYRVRDIISVYEAFRKPWEDKRDYVNKVLSFIETPLCDDIRAVYVEGRSLVEVAHPRYIIASSLRGRINRAIVKAIREVEAHEMCVHL